VTQHSLAREFSRDISSVFWRQLEEGAQGGCEAAFPPKRLGAELDATPGHQKLSAGAIISNAGSHRSLRPAGRTTLLVSSFRSRPLLPPLTPSGRTLIHAPACSIVPGGYFVTAVIIFLPSRPIPPFAVAKISIPSLTDKTTRATDAGSDVTRYDTVQSVEDDREGHPFHIRWWFINALYKYFPPS